MWRFFVLITLIQGTIWYYIWERLIAPCSVPRGWHLLLGLLFTITLMLQVGRWIFDGFVDKHPGVLVLTFIIFGFMVQLFAATCAKDLIWLLWAMINPRSASTLVHLRLLSILTFIICLVGNFVGLITALRGPRVRTVELYVNDWPKSQDGFTIAQISDLHVGAIIKSKYVKAMVSKIQGFHPDLIVATGDMGDGNPHELGEALKPLQSLSAKWGLFYVTGNHEYYWEADQWIAAIKQHGFVPLLNEGILIELPERPLWLAGLPDFTARRFNPHQKPDVEKVRPPQSQAHAFKILLAHQPKACFDAAKARFDLLLSGHTHGGQFFPVNMVIRWFHPYTKGLNKHGSMHVYVNPGTGYWGPPLRLGVPAEITRMRLRSAVNGPEHT